MVKQETMRYDEFRALQRGKVPQGNRKVLNATKTERNGVTFDSRVEQFMYDLLTMHGIRFEFQKRYELQEGFAYAGEKVRAITYTVDFWLPEYDTIIDTKGVMTQQGAMRIKLLKHRFAMKGLQPRIELPKDKDQCVALVRGLLEKRVEK